MLLVTCYVTTGALLRPPSPTWLGLHMKHILKSCCVEVLC